MIAAAIYGLIGGYFWWCCKRDNRDALLVIAFSISWLPILILVGLFSLMDWFLGREKELTYESKKELTYEIEKLEAELKHEKIRADYFKLRCLEEK